jgi:hypothetical protein
LGVVRLKLPQIQAATILSVIAIGISAASLIYSKRSYDLSAAKDQRELMDKMPAVDVQVTPAGASIATVTIAITNRGDINITPLDITVEHSLEIGDLYLSSAQQSVDRLKSSLSLLPIGTITPKAVGRLKATVFGVTDGKADSFKPGLEFLFAVRIQFSDEQDTIRTFPVVRRIIPPVAAEPCPPEWTLAPRPPGCPPGLWDKKPRNL